MNKPIRSISELKNKRRIVNRFPIPPLHSNSVNANRSDNNKIEIKKQEVMFNKHQIIEVYDRNKIDYEDLKESCEFNMVNTDDVDVSVIIPVRGRENFNM